MRTGRGFERLVNFSDAVVAIALTLLVLPLVEIPVDLDSGVPLDQLFNDHRTELTSFLISFLVIWALWVSHHQTMEHFRAYDGVIVRLHMVWLFTIVVLPFTTQLLNSDESDEGAVPLYIGILLVSSLALVGISWWGRRHHELLDADHEDVKKWLAEPLLFVTVTIMALAFVVCLVVPSLGTWPLLLLLLDDPIERIVGSRVRPARRRAS